MTGVAVQDPVAALHALGVPRPIWAQGDPEIGLTKAGGREWRYWSRFLSTIGLVPIAHLVANGWAVTIDRARNGLLIKISKKETHP